MTTTTEDQNAETTASEQANKTAATTTATNPITPGGSSSRNSSPEKYSQIATTRVKQTATTTAANPITPESSSSGSSLIEYVSYNSWRATTQVKQAAVYSWDSSSRDSLISEQFSSETHTRKAKNRVEELRSSLAGKFFIAGKNKKDQNIYENLFETLPPDVPRDGEAWRWVPELNEWNAFVNVAKKTNEPEFYALLNAFFKDERVKQIVDRSGKAYMFSGDVPVKTFRLEHDRGAKGNNLKPDIFSTSRPSLAPVVNQCSADDDEHCWEEVEVMWELKSNEKRINNEEDISTLALKATEVMRVQWGRRFVIGIFACGTRWRLCWFDRAGGVTHHPFDIKSNPQLFACCVLSPFLLPHSELGMTESSSTIKVENQMFTLGETIARPWADRLVSRGTFIRKARRSDDDSESWPFCIKSSWQCRERLNEIEALSELQHIPGVVKLVASQTEEVNGVEDTISHCRRDMPIEPGSIFPSLKRPREAPHYYESAYKIRRLDGSSIGRTHSLEELPTNPFFSTNTIQPSFYDKIHRVVVMENSGRRYDDHENTPLQKILCLRQVVITLCAVRDAGWLHRDISPANIMVPFKNKNDPLGIIIDWDMARKVDDSDAGAQERTGTLWYMAVNILENPFEPPIHHALHDLESVFWLGLIDGLRRSYTLHGDSWLEDFYESRSMKQVGTYKRGQLATERLLNFQKCFSEQYLVMGQLLRAWLSVMFYADSGIGPTFIYAEPNNYKELFDKVKAQFETFIAMEEERAFTVEKGEAGILIESSIMGQLALEQQQRPSEHSVINNSSAAESSNRVEDVESPPKARRKPSTCSKCGVEGHTYKTCPGQVTFRVAY